MSVQRTERYGSAVSEMTWEELEKEIFTPEEIAESDRRVAEMSEAIRNDEGMRSE